MKSLFQKTINVPAGDAIPTHLILLAIALAQEKKVI